MNRNRWVRCVLIVVSTFLVMCMSGLTSGWAAPTTITTVLDLAYGNGVEQVGALKAHELDPSAPPSCPAMFQMTRDGAVWVLDTVNARVLEFKDGHQTGATEVARFTKSPDYFGVTTAAVFVFKQGRRNDLPSGIALRIDRATKSEVETPLDFPDGRRFLPLRVSPIGSDESQLLVYGVTWPDSATATVVLGQDGKISSVQEDPAYALSHMPGIDGLVWRLKTGDERCESDLPGSIEKWNPTLKEWQGVPVVLPKIANLFTQRKVVIVRALGRDAQGISVFMMVEGSPVALKFIRVGPAGEVIGSYSFTELGLSQAPITSYFNAECYQVLPDGSLLIQYPSLERYRILRISF